jgi:hypothetical protein
MKLLILSLRSWVEVKEFGAEGPQTRHRTLRARMENQSSIWLSQEDQGERHLATTLNG